MNIAKDTQDLSDLLYDYLGCTQSLVLEPLSGEGTEHIDMFSKLVDPNTMLLGYYRESDDPLNAYILDENARRLQSFARANQWPLKIIRVPMPPVRYTGAYPSYTNSLIVNDLVIIPIYSQHKQYEAEAIEAYRQALGDTYELILINADQIIEMGGAVHCTTMGIVNSPNFVEAAQSPSD